MYYFLRIPKRPWFWMRCVMYQVQKGQQNMRFWDIHEMPDPVLCRRNASFISCVKLEEQKTRQNTGFWNIHTCSTLNVIQTWELLSMYVCFIYLDKTQGFQTYIHAQEPPKVWFWNQFESVCLSVYVSFSMSKHRNFKHTLSNHLKRIVNKTMFLGGN